MNSASKSQKRTLKYIAIILLAIAITKGFWLFIDLKFLPQNGVEIQESTKVKPLFYRYALASQNKANIKAKIINKGNMFQLKKKLLEPPAIKSFKLLGIYSDKDKAVITVEYRGKKKVLLKGDTIEGYTFVRATLNEAYFKKDGKEYMIKINNPKIPKNALTQANEIPEAISNLPKKETKKENNTNNNSDVKMEGDIRVVPKKVIMEYKKNPSSLLNDIAITPIKENNKINGFKVRYVRKGSFAYKLGLRKGDIIKAINGEEINGLEVPMEFFNSIGSLQGATITIKRGNQEKELEYEIR